MKRIVNYYLNEWKENSDRLPLLIRGARGIGKTYVVRELAKSFPNFIEVNFENDKEQVQDLFVKDLDPVRIIRDLSVKYHKEIVPGETLLFFDEIQEDPDGIIALRYFYEKMPKLHVIAAGSLLDFAIEKVGMPVGRVESLYMYPMSFLEFLVADGYKLAAQELIKQDVNIPFSEFIHKMLIDKVGEYLAIGGMPKVVDFWVNKKPRDCFKMQSTIIDNYRQDFGEYAKKHQVKYLERIFNNVPLQLGNKFKYSNIGEYRKRELEPCVDLLEMARVINTVYYTAGQGIPIGAQTNINDIKLIFLDVGLAQSILGADISNWVTAPQKDFINKGSVTEAFVGQEILAYSDQIKKAQLYYWHRDARGSESEIDYLIQLKDKIIPIEVKSGEGRTLKSMNIFLESHIKSPYGIKFSTNNFSIFEKIHSYPLYAVSKLISENSEVYKAVMSLVQ